MTTETSGELWAEFSSNLYTVSNGANLAPVDDRANSVETVDGQSIL
jgi:hypothetical protein